MMHIVISVLMMLVSQLGHSKIEEVLTKLAPQIGNSKIKEWSDLIVFESKWYDVHPLLVVSFVHNESGWNPRKKSVTRDYGLMQVHVARRGSARFLGRERELYKPRINIREGVRILAMWKGYHDRWCKGDDHPYWAHQKWGKKVKDDRRDSRVTRMFEYLKSRFEPKAVAMRH